MPTFWMKLYLIIFWRKLSVVLFSYLIKEDLKNVLLLLACKPWGIGMILWFRAAVSTPGRSHFGLHWSWSKSHRSLLSRCSAGTTSSTCYLKQRLLDMWAEWSKDQWRPNVNDQASKSRLWIRGSCQCLRACVQAEGGHFEHP